MNDRLAYIALNGIADIGPVRVKALLEVFGTPAAILTAPAAKLQCVPGIGPRIAATVAGWRESMDPEGEAALADRSGVTIVTLADDAYPDLLKEIHDPPLCLYVRGDLSVLENLQSAIAIVGSRHTTRYGIQMAELLAGSAAVAGWKVISGLARGIDTVSHQACLAAGGKTVAVVGSGLGRLYPQENLDLARAIVHNGAVISEFPMQFPPSKRTFPMRNRIISGLTVGTIVVQAGFKSGSIITATQALDQNRQVFAVPGPADHPQSRGCHALIKKGTAKLVENFTDVLEEFSFIPGLSADVGKQDILGDKNSDKPLNQNLTLSPGEAKLCALIGDDEISIDDLVLQSGLSAPEVLSTVFMLEIKHLVKQLPGRRVYKV